MNKKTVLLAGLLATVCMPLLNPAVAQEQNAADQGEFVLSSPAAPASLVLEQAIAWALENSPALGASSARADAATASRSQAGALPNPELSVELDNIYGDGPYDGLDGADITYGVSQLVELPGKRGNRVRVADAEKNKIHYARDAARLDLIRDITIGFASVVAAQQDVAILEEEYTLATAVLDSVAAKVKAGKEPAIQRNKADIERSSSQIALDRAKRDLVAKKQALSSLMGGQTGDFIAALDSLPPMAEPQPFDIYRSRLPQTPDIKSLDSDVNRAKAGLSLERANAVPDPTFSVGVKDMREDDTRAFVAGVSFPFPVFNMNRAGIARAGHELNAAMLDQRGIQLSYDADLNGVYSDFVSAYNEARALQTSVLPGAEEAFSFARQGYEAGKFGYLEVLDTQRTLFETRKQFNQSVLDYHRQRAIIERMTAVHNDENTTKEARNEKVTD